MFAVTTMHLTPDLRTAQPDLGACDFGQLDEGQLLVLLERFREIDAVQNHDADPHLIVQSSTGKFVIRTGQRKLYFADARDRTQPAVELDASAIARELTRRPPPPADVPLETYSSRVSTRHGIAIAMLVSCLLLNGYTVYSFYHIDDLNRKPPVALVTDSSELTALRNSAVGRYATGTAEGDRMIEIDAANRVRFLRVGKSGERLESEDSYRLGRTGEKLCLTMPRSGLIEIVNIDSLVYYRDVYRRVR